MHLCTYLTNNIDPYRLGVRGTEWFIVFRRTVSRTHTDTLLALGPMLALDITAQI